MKTIEQLAREVWLIEFIPESDIPKLQRFHDLAIAQYREGLLAGVGEPVAYRTEESTNGVRVWLFKKTAVKYQDPPDALYTADQMAAAVAVERERCAKVLKSLKRTQAMLFMNTTEKDKEAMLAIIEARASIAAVEGSNANG